ncbi:hypothetical protein JVU11DRAFT_6719 [Chiua virens]|nr:hypothetical protein JVU11DRAFT_6719 [Chiua virens]
MTRHRNPKTYTISRAAASSGSVPPPPRRQRSSRFRPHTRLLSTAEVDTLAQQTITYMNALAEHAAAMRTHPRAQDTYQNIVEQGRVLPPETKWPSLDRKGQDDLRCQMEAIMRRSATTPEDHLEILSATHTLILLQQNILNGLPYPESRRVDAKINELRAARRQQFSQQGEHRFPSLIPPLPPIQRPDLDLSTDSCNIAPGLLDSLLNLPSVPAIIGRRFLFFDPSSDTDILYQIHSVEMSSSGHRFAVQSDGARDTTMLDRNELKEMLQCSVVV